MGKRTSLIDLESNTEFFPAATKAVYEKYLPACLNLVKQFENVEKIILYGELFGGMYPTFEKKGIHIQKQIVYCPHYEFYAFDLYVIKENNSTAYWITHEQFCNIVPNAGFSVYAKPLLIGTLQQVLDMEVRFDSKVPQMFFPDLPAVTPNICEGVVIKPFNNTIKLPSGDRAVVKKKNQEFLEMVPKEKVKAKPIPMDSKSMPLRVSNELFIFHLFLQFCALEHHLPSWNALLIGAQAAVH